MNMNIVMLNLKDFSTKELEFTIDDDINSAKLFIIEKHYSNIT